MHVHTRMNEQGYAFMGALAFDLLFISRNPKQGQGTARHDSRLLTSTRRYEIRAGLFASFHETRLHGRSLIVIRTNVALSWRGSWNGMAAQNRREHGPLVPYCGLLESLRGRGSRCLKSSIQDCTLPLFFPICR